MKTRSLIVLFCGVSLAAGCKKDDDAIGLPNAQAATTKPAASPTSQKVADGPQQGQPIEITGRLMLNGTTRARRVSALAPQVSGRVAQVAVKEGDVVQAGQLLVALDRRDFLLGLRQARAARATAKAQVDAALVEWRRLNGLLKANAIPRGQFDTIDSQLKVARAALAQAEVAIAAAQSALAKTQVKAPFRAVVTRKMTEVGAYATVMPPSPVVQIEELDTLEVLVQVPEAETAQVKVGTPLSLSFSAINRRIEAKVARVIPSLDPRTRSFTAIVELENKDHSLRPGMFVEVTEPRR